jgi:hypothetical protein
MNEDNPDLPEATYLDASDAAWYKPFRDPETGERGPYAPDSVPTHDREFRYGLRYSNYREATAEELEAMDLKAFSRSWDGVKATCGEFEITEDLKRSYIDRLYMDLFVEQLDQAFERMREKGIGVFGTRELLSTLRSCRRGLAASIIHEDIPQMPDFFPLSCELYPQDNSPVCLTNEARDVLKRSKAICADTGERVVANEHLLLALLESEDSDVRRHLNASFVPIESIGKKLRQFLGLWNDRPIQLSPRLRAYQLCSLIECDLKDALLDALRKFFGDDWWAKGVPLKTRLKCVATREEEDCVLPSESYLYLMSYKEVIKQNWELFGSAMERASGEKGKDKATGWMNDLNPIRNAVMHPGKREITSEDLDR